MPNVNIDYRVNKSEVEAATRSLREAQRAVSGTEDELQKARQEVTRFKNESSGLSQTFGNLKTAVGALGLGIAVREMWQFTKQVIDTKAEFQKFEAVLTNTLGSQSAAQRALRMINTFVAQTPFQVDEVTAAFVKLANQGFIPTTSELTKLGDLAASTGKGFDQLTEAIIDAQVGEFERLKEFGIRASKEGDNVTFTFRGVQKQVDFTAEAIQQYVLSLGDAEGVSGAMAAISETLGGKISNLEDAFTNLKVSLGNFVEGPAGGFVSWITEVTNDVANLINVMSGTDVGLQVDSSSLEAAEQRLGEFVKQYNTLREDLAAGRYQDKDAIEGLINLYSQRIDEQTEVLQQLAGNNGKVAEETEKLGEKTKMTAAEQKKAAEEAKRYAKELEEIEMKAIRLRNTLEKLAPDQEDSLLKQFKKVFGDVNKDAKTGEDLDFFLMNPAKLGDADKLFDQATDMFKKKQKRLHDEQEEAEAEHQARMSEIREGALQGAFDLAGAYYDFLQAKREDDIQNLRNEADFELSLVGDNEQAKRAIRQEAAEKERQIRQQQARDQKALAIFDIVVNTAAAVVEALPNLILSGIVGGVGIAQLALVAGRPIPQYNKGTKSVPGFKKGFDSVLAMLTPEERVVDVGTNKMYQPALDAIQDHRIDPKIINDFVKGQSKTNTIVVNDYNALIRAWKENPHVTLQVNEKGFLYHAQRKGSQITKDIHEFRM